MRNLEIPEDSMFLMSTVSQRKLMVDSGASEHLVNEVDCCTEEELKTRRPIEDVRRMRSALGTMWITECVDLWIEDFFQMFITAG